jgi:transcription elongation factor GreA
MSIDPIYVSREGLQKMKDELRYLKTEKRQEIAARIEIAKDLGDLSENAEYTEAKDQFSFTEGRIIDLEDAVMRATVIENQGNDVVRIGCRVRVGIGDKEKEFTIVGAPEADPIKGLISNESPIGRALIGKKAGDKADVSAPSGVVRYTILGIG